MGFPRRGLAGAFALVLIWATPATAGVPHTVEPGETLWSIAAASNLTTRALAAANGLPETAQVVVGETVTIPSESEAAVALGLGGGRVVTGPSISAGGPPPSGAYTVRPGDTLTGIAARSGVTAGQVAFMNGLAPDARVSIGTVLKLPAGAVPRRAPSRPRRRPRGSCPRRLPSRRPAG